MPPRAASATRALARTDTFMPMKPAAAEARPPIGEADRDLDVLERDQRDEQDDADDADRRCTGAAGTPERLPGRPPTGVAWSRCPATAPATIASSRRRTPRRATRRRRRSMRRGRTGNWTRGPLWTLTTRNDGPIRAAVGAPESTARLLARDPQTSGGLRRTRSFGLFRASGSSAGGVSPERRTKAIWSCDSAALICPSSWPWRGSSSAISARAPSIACLVCSRSGAGPSSPGGVARPALRAPRLIRVTSVCRSTSSTWRRSISASICRISSSVNSRCGGWVI